MTETHKLVLVTVPNNDVAETLAQQLISERLAACINILPGITSVYQWNNKIEKDSEVLLLIKTTTNVIDQLQKKVVELHPYELPEFICLAIEQGSSDYLDWISQCTKH